MLMTFYKSVPLIDQRLAVMNAKEKRNHGKRHAVGQRSAKHKLKVKSIAAHAQAQALKKQRQLLRAARAYWHNPIETVQGLSSR